MHIQLNQHKVNILELSKLDNLEPTICFIPGAGMDHRTAQMIGFANLKDRCNIIAIDLPWHLHGAPVTEFFRPLRQTKGASQLRP